MLRHNTYGGPIGANYPNPECAFLIQKGVILFLFYFILGAEQEEKKTDGVKFSADQEH